MGSWASIETDFFDFFKIQNIDLIKITKQILKSNKVMQILTAIVLNFI